MIHPQKQSCEAYVRGVIAGEIQACKLIRKACERHVRDLETGEARGIYFDPASADRAITFIECLHHSKGRWRGQLLILSGWQRFVLASLFGWKRLATGFRRFKTAYVEIPRKNGKSTLASAIALYLLVGDGEGGPEVYTAATSRDQAKIVFEECRRMVKASRELRRRLAVLQNLIAIENRDASLRPLHSKSENLDGLNTHGAVIDEYHEHRTSEVKDKIATSTGARDQALVFTITTAGNNIESPCYHEREEAINVLEGVTDDDTCFVFIACPDEGDDWTSEETWWRANPNLGVSRSLDNMREDFGAAVNSPLKAANFKRYYLDVWTNEEVHWIKLEDWRACPGEPIAEEELRGRPCYIGIDAAAVQDTTAVAFDFPAIDGRPPILYVRFFMPRELVAKCSFRDHVPYHQWVDEGWMIATPGNATDTESIRAEINRLARLVDIRSIGCDPWNMLTLAAQLQDEDGFRVEMVQQTLKMLSAPAKSLQTDIIRHVLRHGDNRMLTWQVSHTCVISDGKENYMPHKKKSRKRIDGVAAAVTARRMTIDAEEPASVGLAFV